MQGGQYNGKRDKAWELSGCAVLLTLSVKGMTSSPRIIERDQYSQILRACHRRGGGLRGFAEHHHHHHDVKMLIEWDMLCPLDLALKRFRSLHLLTQ